MCSYTHVHRTTDTSQALLTKDKKGKGKILEEVALKLLSMPEFTRYEGGEAGQHDFHFTSLIEEHKKRIQKHCR
jgi:hypothetical protein